MCHFIDRFPEYKTLIARCINSCDNPIQLYCTYDMIDRFKEVFKFSISPQSLDVAANELYEAYRMKLDTITIL